jgi:hypothetical protein
MKECKSIEGMGKTKMQTNPKNAFVTDRPTMKESPSFASS